MKESTRTSLLESSSRCIRKMIHIMYGGLSKIKKNPKEYMLTEICKELEDEKFAVSFSMKPKMPDAVPQLSINHNASFAIVMQGPIRREENFTESTVRYYKRIYGDVPVIVSTWEDEDESAIEQVKNAGAEVILCQKPASAGHLNVNFQLVNSLEGIKYAHSLGVQYIAKTRTDQQLSKPDIFTYMANLIKQFPANGQLSNEGRIVTLSMNYGNMFHPYLLSDFMYFGSADNMIKLFSIPLDSREEFSVEQGSSRRKFSQMCDAPEVYIIVEFLKSIGYECEFTVDAYWKALKDYFICVDRKTIGLIWPKYVGKYKEHEFLGEYFSRDNAEKLMTMNFDFVNWLNLYSGTLEYEPEFEKYADVIFK